MPHTKTIYGVSGSPTLGNWVTPPVYPMSGTRRCITSTKSNKKGKCSSRFIKVAQLVRIHFYQFSMELLPVTPFSPGNWAYRPLKIVGQQAPREPRNLVNSHITICRLDFIPLGKVAECFARESVAVIVASGWARRNRLLVVQWQIF